MGDDSGYQAAIAEIPRGQLSERQQRIAAGLAMIRVDGSSVHAAAKAVQIPYSTLYDHNRGLTDPDYEKGFKANERGLVDGLMSIATLASEKIFERVEADTMRDGDLIKAQGVAIDKIAMKRRWAQTQTQGSDRTHDALAAALEAMRQGAKVSIEQPDPVADAIEIQTIDGE